MARFRQLSWLALLGAPTFIFLFLPRAASAAGFFGPVLPQSGSCDCGALPMDWGCVLQVIQNLIQLAVSLGVIICVLWIAYAGFSLMVSGGSPEARSKGKTRITNALVGIVVILAAWLVVDFVMKTIYKPDAAFSGGSFGPWNAILADTGGNYCIQEHTPVAITAGDVMSHITTTAPGTTAPGANVGEAGGLCTSNQYCTAASLQGYGLTSGQAQAMSCIAQTESSGDPNSRNPSSGACGLFQILSKYSNSNWQQPSNHQSPCSVSTSCTNAACNAQTAVIMFHKSGYSPWTCPGCNAKAAACVATYDH